MINEIIITASFCHAVLPEPVDNQNIEQVVTVGEDVIIQCPLRFGSLHQHHNVKWTVDGNPIQNSSTYSILNDPTERVIVNNVNPDHRIKFQCVSTLNGQRPVKSPVVLLMPYGKLHGQLLVDKFCIHRSTKNIEYYTSKPSGYC